MDPESGAGSFESFYLASRSGVLRSTIAASGGEPDAENAVAEAYARAFARWSDVAAHPAPEAWVMRTAMNLMRDSHRRRKSAAKALPRLVTDEGREDAAQFVDPAVLRAIRSLPARQREVLAMRVLLDLSADTTAQLLGISVGSVGRHLHRALATLRRTLHPFTTPIPERNSP